MSDIRSLLEKLSNAHGISGREGAILEIVRGEISSLVDEVRTDALGNLIAIKHGEKPSIMIEAHADEIGLMVKYVDEKGFIYFAKIGGWFDQTLLNQRVIVHGTSGPVVGVLGSKPIHFMKEEERKKLIEYRDMFIDIGCQSDKEVAELGIIEGTPITMDRSFASLNGDKVTGKAFDNRAGLVMMVEALKRTKSNCTIYVVATVQEEIGFKGAKVSAFGLNPDLAIASDVTIPGDHPGIEKKDSHMLIGKGPVVTVADASGRGLIASLPIMDWINGTAKEFGIEIQLNVAEAGATDGMVIQLTRAGIPTAVLSIATRYIHSPVEVLSLSDIDSGAELMARAMESAPKYFKI
ncbi:MAG: M42 family metallopeptidase [Methanothrix sp.]|nr:M42 family metallopeptidase [Methanothrix sp.]